METLSALKVECLGGGGGGGEGRGRREGGEECSAR